MRGIETVLVPEIREGPVAEFGLVRGCIDLLHNTSASQFLHTKEKGELE